MSEHEIFVRDGNMSRVAQISDYQQLSMVLRHNNPGTWMLELPQAELPTQLLNDFSAGIEVVSDGVTLLSGPVTRLQRSWSGNVDQLTVSGPDDSVWLQRRLALPVPGGPPYTIAEHDVRTGAAETVLRQYVDVNLGPSAATPRRVGSVVLAADQGRGSTITGRARFQNLLELLQGLALAGGDLGFRLIQVSTTLEFQVYVPVDKTATAVFSKELGNLRAFEYHVEAATQNYVIAGGGGEGTARTFVEKGDSQSILDYGRIEAFRDGRDTTVSSELLQRVDEDLAESAERTGLSITPVDLPHLAFMQDYVLGDKVTVVVDDIPVQDVVREVTISLTPNEGAVIQPIIGTPGTKDALGIFGHLRKLAAQVSHLERR